MCIYVFETFLEGPKVAYIFFSPLGMVVVFHVFISVSERAFFFFDYMQ